MHRSPDRPTRRVVTLALVAAGALAAILLGAPEAIPQEVRQVFVTNFPAVQPIDGTVTVEQPVPLAAQRSARQVVVPPVDRSQTTRLVSAGVLRAGGFPSVVLSLYGETKGQVGRAGAVGAILIPDEPGAVTALDEQGLTHFALETVAPEVTASTPMFASNQTRYTVGFGSYRILLFNETDRTVTVDLVAYLTQ